jgi:hypothetical protein
LFGIRFALSYLCDAGRRFAEERWNSARLIASRISPMDQDSQIKKNSTMSRITRKNTAVALIDHQVEEIESAPALAFSER